VAPCDYSCSSNREEGFKELGKILVGVTGTQNFHNMQLPSLYTSLNIVIRVIKSRRLG
jgi:hypothetical protein